MQGRRSSHRFSIRADVFREEKFVPRSAGGVAIIRLAVCWGTLCLRKKRRRSCAITSIIRMWCSVSIGHQICGMNDVRGLRVSVRCTEVHYVETSARANERIDCFLSSLAAQRRLGLATLAGTPFVHGCRSEKPTRVHARRGDRYDAQSF